MAKVNRHARNEASRGDCVANTAARGVGGPEVEEVSLTRTRQNFSADLGLK